MSMDFGMDKCLQSDVHQSHSDDADWIVKNITRQESNACLCVIYTTHHTVLYFGDLWCQISNTFIILIVLFLT